MVPYSNILEFSVKGTVYDKNKLKRITYELGQNHYHFSEAGKEIRFFAFGVGVLLVCKGQTFYRKEIGESNVALKESAG